MTNREALTLTWRKFGMTEARIADGLEQHALRFPGTLDKDAQFPAGKENECIAEMVQQMQNLAKLLPNHYHTVKRVMDEAERDINSSN